MQPTALRALEFDRIVDAVRRLAQTPPGADRLARLQPSTDPREVAAALAGTAETARFLSGTGDIALRAPADLDACLTALAVEGRVLEPQALLGLASFPLLGVVAETAASFEREIGEIRRKIDPAGEVQDSASPELKILRERLRK